MNRVTALLCGTIFGLGLAVSGMTDTTKVIGFLDVFGDWIPNLAFVMASAVVVTTLGYKVVLKKSTPVLEDRFYLPSSTPVDARLIVGAILFGVGWGLYGYCPGPAIAALVYLNLNTVLFVFAMLAGMGLSQIFERTQ